MDQLNYLKQKMIPIVSQCLEKHGGGESYFDELDSLIKNDIELMITYLKYAVEKENVIHVVVSGEIGLILSKLINKKIIPIDINIICLNGGLRKGRSRWELTSRVTNRSKPSFSMTAIIVVRRLWQFMITYISVEEPL